jgi:hypothetical protein
MERANNTVCAGGVWPCAVGFCQLADAARSSGNARSTAYVVTFSPGRAGGIKNVSRQRRLDGDATRRLGAPCWGPDYSMPS